MAHKGGRALFALGALKSILTRFRGQAMQLHYSHQLMQPEGHLGALFSIYECHITCMHARETLCCLLPALASFRQRSTCGPHADAFAGPTQRA